jgi:hypothetical protein
MPINPQPFTRQEALNLWSRLAAGWAHTLDAEGARTLMDGAPNPADVDGSYEGVTRMLWGLGGWLSQPDRPAEITWRGETFDLLALTRRGIVNGCNPTSPSYWGIDYWPDRPYDQRTVESGQIAFALWQSRDRIWGQLTATERGWVYDFLERFGRHPGLWGNNWALFWVLNHAVRKAFDLSHDQTLIDEVMGAYLDGVYCGDGWYDDAAQRGVGCFDDYNIWVFASHVLAWAQVDGHTQPARRDELLERIRQYLEHYPYFFAANGAYSEFGRSLAYKFARLGAPLWAYRLGIWPHSAGMLKRLVGRHLRWYADRGAIRADGTLRQSLTAAGSTEICEAYISTGATYWAMQAFGGLWSLPDDDPFWSAAEEPLPAEQADYVKAYHQPGWLVVAHQGEIQRFNAGSVRGVGSKYAKFVYSTQHPFNVGRSDGLPAPDNMLSLVDGPLRGQRTRTLAYTVDESGWLRICWQQALNGLNHTIETVIVVRGAQHIRAHRITLDAAVQRPVGVIEGSAPLGYIQGEEITLRQDERWALAAASERAVAIFNVRGYDVADFWTGAPGINSVFPFYAQPILTVSNVQTGHELVCLVHTGPLLTADDPIAVTADWLDAGHFRLSWQGEAWTVPPLE